MMSKMPEEDDDDDEKKAHNLVAASEEECTHAAAAAAAAGGPQQQGRWCAGGYLRTPHNDKTVPGSSRAKNEWPAIYDEDARSSSS